MKEVMHVKHKIPQDVNIGIDILEIFKHEVGFDNKQFVEYMNKYNIWNELNDTEVIEGCIWAEEDAIIYLFGDGLPLEEKRRLADKYR